jgi:hypothetical protein
MILWRFSESPVTQTIFIATLDDVESKKNELDTKTYHAIICVFAPVTLSNIGRTAASRLVVAVTGDAPGEIKQSDETKGV